MKFRSLGFVVLLAAFAGSALAQTAISGTMKCPKSDDTKTVEVGDHPGHVLILEKGSCTWGTPLEMAGLKTTAWSGADTVEVTGAHSQARGYSVMTMENGDKAYVRWQGTGTSAKDGTLIGEGSWSYTGGTGKLKGVKGKGTYKISGATDGTSDVQVEATYSLPEPGAAAKKK
jgi:hypothetical protein